MKIILSLGLAVSSVLFTAVCSASEASTSDKSVSAAASVTPILTSVLSRADVAYVGGKVNSVLVKGDVGEAVAGRYLLAHLQESGKWRQLSPRFGRQGLDGLVMKFDTQGRPTGLIVSEVKYGSSQLGMTADGIQMGSRWTNHRLAAMASRYRDVMSSIQKNVVQIGDVQNSDMARHQIQAPLPNGKQVLFWREDANMPWKTTADGQKNLAQAGKSLERISGHLDAASGGKVTCRRYVYNPIFVGNDLHVKVYDVNGLRRAGLVSDLPLKRELVIPMGKRGLREVSGMADSVLAKYIMMKNSSIDKAEALYFARQLREAAPSMEQALRVNTLSVKSQLLRSGLTGGVAVAGISLGVDLLVSAGTNASPNWAKMGSNAELAFISGASGSITADAVTIGILKSGILARSSNIGLGIPTRVLTSRILGGGIGGVVGGVVFAYGGCLLGQYDMQTANLLAASGTIGAIAGTCTSLGLLSAVATFGTASTGVAISSLSGAAAANASLACLGGGSVGAGGLGMAGGAAVLTGTTFVVGAVVSVAVIYGYKLYENHKEGENLLDRANAYKTFDVFVGSPRVLGSSISVTTLR